MMRISIRIRNISMRTPYSTFQYPSTVSACFYLTLNRLGAYLGHNIVIIHMKLRHLLAKMW